MLVVLSGLICALLAFKYYGFLILLFSIALALKKKNKKRCFQFLLGIVIASFIIMIELLVDIIPNFSDVALVIEAKENYLIVLYNLKKYYISMNQNSFQLFDIIKVQGTIKELKFETLEGTFDFKNYLNCNGVFSEFSVSKIETLFMFPLRFQTIKNFLLSLYDEKGQVVIAQLFLINGSTDKTYYSIINSLNIAYFFTFGSFHLHFFNFILYRLLRIKFNEKRTSILTTLTLFPMLFFCWRLSTIRYFMLILIKEIINKKFFKNKLQRHECLALFFIILLTLNYHYVFSSGFWIMVTALFGINEISYVIKIYEIKHSRIAFSLLLNLLLLPSYIYFNQSITLIGWLVSPLIMIYVKVLLVCMPIIPLFNLLSLFLIEFLYNFSQMNTVLYFVNHQAWMILLGSGILLLLLMLEVKNTLLVRKISWSLVILILISQIPFRHLYTQEVVFINVGQGDAILVSNKGTNVLIDTGGKYNFDMAENVLIPFLRKRQIYYLDALIISHDDFDHSGAKQDLIQNFKVKKLIEGSDYDELIIGNMNFKNLNHYCTASSSKNDCSSVLYFKIKKDSFLLTGDITEQIERKIIDDNPNMTVDYLKLAHHGSNSSSSEYFLKNLQIKEAIISVGINNYYHHPSKEVLRRLKKYQINIRRTDIEGTIIYNYGFFK